MAEKFDFNKGLSELEDIVKTMESGDLSLEDSLKRFEQGVILTRQCQTALSEAEQKIALLSAADGYQAQQPLDKES
ncbi:Exodeoxyribonuclease VII small subunit [uncultured Candidatus Thioglobus sp.]|nr:Exodeoxyribonuclease VII small subunit [uncultured Candidatus Thioglobus sp.]